MPDPGPGEALVRVKACGVCHTDLHYREGAINDDFPFLLGHEAAGTVEAVGDGVDGISPQAILCVIAWRAPCGGCRSCVRGQALVLLRQPERQEPDDLGRRDSTVPGPGHRRVHRAYAGGCGAGGEGRPRGQPGSRRADGLRHHGGAGRSHQHRRGEPRRLRGRDRVRRRRRRRHRRRQAGRGPTPSLPMDMRRPQAPVGQGLRRYPYRQLDPGPIRWRPSAT